MHSDLQSYKKCIKLITQAIFITICNPVVAAVQGQGLKITFYIHGIFALLFLPLSHFNTSIVNLEQTFWKRSKNDTSKTTHTT